MDAQKLLPPPPIGRGHPPPGKGRVENLRLGQGRPKEAKARTLARRLLQRTRNGEELIDWGLHVLRGTGPFRNQRIPLQVKVVVWQELLNRSWGRPVQYVEARENGELVMAGVTFIPVEPREPLPEASVVEAETRVVPETQDARR